MVTRTPSLVESEEASAPRPPRRQSLWQHARPGNFEIVAFSASYHGLTEGAGSATYSAGRKNGGPSMPGQLAFPAPYQYRSPFRKADGSYDWETEMDFGWSMIDRQSVGSLAALIMEPILSTGGILLPPKGYEACGGGVQRTRYARDHGRGSDWRRSHTDVLIRRGRPCTRYPRPLQDPGLRSSSRSVIV
jgi:hypothetical protein